MNKYTVWCQIPKVMAGVQEGMDIIRENALRKLKRDISKLDGKGKKLYLHPDITVRMSDQDGDSFIRNNVTVVLERKYKQYRVPRILNRKP